VHYLKFNEDADEDGAELKSMKRTSSWRAVPIHSALVKAGFIDFLIAVKDRGQTRPFEGRWQLTEMPLRIPGREDAVNRKWSHEMSKWGGKQLDRLAKLNKLTPRKGQSYFHSMRHTFTTHLASQGVGEEDWAMLCGQSHGGINSTRYNKLRHDSPYLSLLVERHLTAYEKALQQALEAPIAVRYVRKNRTRQ
jgi:integrase